MTLNLENRLKRTDKSGFTLIELLVVIAIIGVLAAVVLVSLNTARQRGRDAKRLADLDAMRLALEVYADQNGSVYPDVAAIGTTPDNTQFGEFGTALVAAELLSATPQDPVTGRVYVAQASATTSPTAYILGADLETTQAACDSDYDNASLDGGGDTACDDDTAGCDGDDADNVDYCICQGSACS